MSLYTRGGDDGTTSLGDGSRTSKSSMRVRAYGTIDEATSSVGLARVVVSDTAVAEVLAFMQQRLLNCSSALAVPSAGDASAPVSPEDIALLEAAADRLESRTGTARGFIVQCGCEAAARMHVARTVMRRAEREVVGLAEQEPVAEGVLPFLNRCSDVLFAAARRENELAGWPDELWDRDAEAPRIDQ